MNDVSQSQDRRDVALSRRIMRRIYLVATIRLLIHPAFLKALIATVFLWRSTAYVSYRHVIANAPNLFDVKRDIGFYSAALMGAEWVTIALLAAVLVLVAWGSYDVFGKRSQAWL